MMRVIDPATGKVVRDFAEATPAEARAMVAAADAAFLEWRKSSFAQRSKLMKAAAGQLREQAKSFASLMAEEMGKPIRQGEAEIEKCAWVCDYYADNAELFLQPESIATDGGSSYVTFQPLGVVLAIMPWNFPFWQVFRFAAPALMAGNAALLKHASNVPGSALAIERVFEQAGFPKNLFRALLVGGSRVDSVIEDSRIRAVTLTGSTQAGKTVAGKAGLMLKKTVLELGGSDPYIVLQDADIEHAVKTCVASRLINAGQSCIAAKRFIVVESVSDRFQKLFVEEMGAYKMGDPHDRETDIGPLARHDLRDELHQQVLKSIDRGAKCLLGGEIPKGEGAYYPPTVLAEVKPGMPAYEQELFGPVAAIIPVRDEKEAIESANDSVFGLGAAVFTEDIERGERIAAEQLQAGCCFVNALVKSDPRLPFGGIKESGYGRELSSYGIKEFVNIKTVYIK
ncbi:MAG: NAD-dependent succinate-semialdehyde dehydrogenase [Deltaproteobacteria bacterium]|nr:NAD-dependent succinate-semialdehyde dehydrogenase [Deltaproteobacteria bacterium]